MVHASRRIDEVTGGFVATNSGFAGKTKGLDAFLKSSHDIVKRRPPPKAKTLDDLFALAEPEKKSKRK